MNPNNVLLLPGWLGSGPGHWQSLWARRHGYRMLEQHDFERPLRGDWIARLNEVVHAASEPVLLVAHSLGCTLAAAWAAHSPLAHRVSAALLVAPPDLEHRDTPDDLLRWRPLPRQRLPFRARVLASTNDPWCGIERAADMATAWGTPLDVVGPLGHINAASDLGAWAAGHALFEALRDNDELAAAHALHAVRLGAQAVPRDARPARTVALPQAAT
jgi:predicted alpha/beta hydrolase family esterase